MCKIVSFAVADFFFLLFWNSFLRATKTVPYNKCCVLDIFAYTRFSHGIISYILHIEIMCLVINKKKKINLSKFRFYCRKRNAISCWNWQSNRVRFLFLFIRFGFVDMCVSFYFRVINLIIIFFRLVYFYPSTNRIMCSLKQFHPLQQIKTWSEKNWQQ